MDADQFEMKKKLLMGLSNHMRQKEGDTMKKKLMPIPEMPAQIKSESSTEMKAGSLHPDELELLLRSMEDDRLDVER